MSGKRITAEDLRRLGEDELIARYAGMGEGYARVRVLDELARRGVEWAAKLARIEREQYAADRAQRQHITDLPEVARGQLDPQEAMDGFADAQQTVPEDHIVYRVIAPEPRRSLRMPRPSRPSSDRWRN